MDRVISEWHADYRKARNKPRYFMMDYFGDYAIVDTITRSIVRTGMNKPVISEMIKTLNAGV